MNDYTSHMITRCVGRYLIDLPDDMQPGKMAAATFAIFPYSEYSGALRVKIVPMAKSVFDGALAQRKENLEGKRVLGHSEWTSLESITHLSRNEGVIFNWANGMTRSTRRLELHGWKNGYAIKMTIDALDESFPENKGDPQELKEGADVPQKLSMLKSLYARTRGRSPDTIPTEPGVCIQNGFISGHASDKMREDISMDFVAKSMPDVNFAFNTDSGIHEDDTLLDRSPAIEANVKAADGEIIRKDKHTSQAGLHYQEVLATGDTPHDHVKGQLFMLEANSKTGSAQSPLLTVDFFNGSRERPAEPSDDDLVRKHIPQILPPLAKASLTEAESVALWDKVTATLRKRPGAF